MFILKAFGLVLGCTFLFALLGFLIPFVIAQFDENPAWSFVPMITVPIGVVLGIIGGIVGSVLWLR